MLSYLRTLLFFTGLFTSSISIATTMVAITEFELEISEGEFITVRSGGSAQSQWLETANGDIIVKRSGTWYLAEINSQNQALSTGIPFREGEVIPAELVVIPDLSLSASIDALESTYVASQGVALSSSSNVIQQPILVLRVSFIDQDYSYSSQSIYELMFADELSSSLSVAQYYRDNSYQKFDIQPIEETSGIVDDGIVDVVLSYNHPNFGASYGSASSQLVRDALISANTHVNFDSFDTDADGSLSSRELGVVLIIAGYENAYGGAGASEPKVWAHKSSVSPVTVDGVSLSAYAMFGEQHQDHLATIGIISHEMAHLLFSLPDLYDRQGDSNGVGRWGLMGLGSWNSTNGVSGSSPAHLLAWSKTEIGFISPRDVEGDSIDFSLKSVAEKDDVLRVWLDPFRHGEHFLLEYRSKEGADKGLPGAGLLISHVDEWVGYGTAGLQNDVVEHKLVDIEEADGLDDLDFLQNRGDREDVYNDAYGQDYFGFSSLPDSLDYQGNSSGFEVAQIRVGDEVTGNLSVPYEQLGNNLGYDDGGVHAAWGNGGSVSLVEYSVSSDGRFAHGIDFYSYRNAVISTSLYTSFTGGAVSNALHVSSSTISPGWNRIEFSSPLDLSNFSKVYLEITASADSLRAFGIDNVGDVSGKSYIKLNGAFQSAGFDFNQRLLVANQEDAFNYQIPDKLSFQEIEVAEASSSGGGGGSFGLFLILAALVSSIRIKLSYA